jgi:serine/threonine-protein kinase
MPAPTPVQRPASGAFPQSSVNSSGNFPTINQPEMRYEIVAELGRGGMGVVHKALDRKLDRHVALKILPWQLQGDEQAKRYFEREAKAIAALKHPNVVALYDFGEGFGSLYLAMEFLEGPNLQSLLKNDPDRVRLMWREWFIQSARGVAAAHAKGLLHRDLKPANLMLDEHGNIRILDFGLARPEAESGATSKLIGTPAFFPPEVLRGEMPTPASDVYSLGATFYTLATGRWPYVGDDILVARLERDPDDPRPYAKFLREDEVGILMKALARHRPERFPDAGELLAALLAVEG